MSEMNYNEDFRFQIRDTISGEVLGGFRYLVDAEQTMTSLWVEMGLKVQLLDSKPKPKIPEDAEFISWEDPYANGEERIARRYGHPANKVWRMGVDTLEESELLKEWIGNAEITVLVRRESE